MFDSSYKGLKNTLSAERGIYLSESKVYRFMDWLKQSERYQLWCYVKVLRYCGYYYAHREKSFLFRVLSLHFRRRLNVCGAKLGIVINPLACDVGLNIWHSGVVVGGNVGKNLMLHGDNCIGRKGLGLDDTPTIGDNVRLGVGAKVIGDVYIANNVTIAAGAVVTKSCYEEGALLAGVPARIIKHNEK